LARKSAFEPHLVFPLVGERLHRAVFQSEGEVRKPI
jgi:hypothetical protein